jgi:hypothetical protein
MDFTSFKKDACQCMYEGGYQVVCHIGRPFNHHTGCNYYRFDIWSPSLIRPNNQFTPVVAHSRRILEHYIVSYYGNNVSRLTALCMTRTCRRSPRPSALANAWLPEAYCPLRHRLQDIFIKNTPIITHFNPCPIPYSFSE